jgi:prepilin-type N-terminal cleavage/methylation domain-containing protein
MDDLMIRRMLERARQRHSRPSVDDDAGMSMIEVVVGMTLMGIFLALFTTAMVSMFGAVNKVDAVDNSAQQINTAFSRLDAQVRYASAVRTPYQANGDWYVAFTSPTPASSGQLNTMCTQLKVAQAVGSLQERTWIVSTDTTSASSVSGWAQLATGVANGGATATAANRPFVIPVATGNFQQLQVNLQANDGSGSAGAQSFLTSTFTALNSSGAASNGVVCGQVTSP